ncbi:MAG TPA: acyl-CoA synthetase FdrA [Caldilineaceae bacterium]|nr:acyl-CoA synthetase FdrA [Caldilineaceae bacterium]
MKLMVRTEVRRGAYYDSVVLMQLQRALAALPGVTQAGVVMATPANKEVLAGSALLTPEAEVAAADDLVIAVEAANAEQATAALAQVEHLLTRRSQSSTPDEYQPKTLAAAVQMLPAARWVLVSTPGRFAAGVAHDALQLGKNVFLYSDNVALAEEVALKQQAAARGLLLMGPDCGTAIINGIGLGFANRVRRGSIGLVGASGTGLQLVTARIHQLGGGITHALGTGGRDLAESVGGLAAKQALDLLSRDADTEVIVLVSKPPAPAIAEQLFRLAAASGKPVVINFIGHQAKSSPGENIHFARTLEGAAQLAVTLASQIKVDGGQQPATAVDGPSPDGKFLRALYSGGTLAYEALLLLADDLPAVYSNTPLDKRFKLEKATVSQGHTVVDLGEDEFTVGRLHPMLDNELRIKRLLQEAADSETAILLLDVVLGDGAHPDPASELAPAITQARSIAAQAGRRLEVVAVVVGTDQDPQGLQSQIEQLQMAGAQVELSNEAAVRAIGARLRRGNLPHSGAPVDLAALHAPLTAVNVGLESFAASLQAQGATALHIDWRPPAGGNDRLAGILARMKGR